jgi:hypothetical protein
MKQAELLESSTVLPAAHHREVSIFVVKTAASSIEHILVRK